MSTRPTSYFLETKRSAVGRFCGTMIIAYVSAVYAVVRLSVCQVVLKIYCVKTLGRIAGRVAVPPGSL